MASRVEGINQDDLRVFAALFSVLLTGAVVALVSYQVDPGSKLAQVFLDREGRVFPYPFTMQNLMYLIFAVGASEVGVRIYSAATGRKQLDKGLLDTGTSKPLSLDDLAVIQKRVLDDGRGRDHHLHRLIHRIIVQYDATGSTSDARAVLDTSTELFQHAISLRYTLLRYLTWLLPTLGFIGTLVGISLALGQASSLPELSDSAAIESWIGSLTANLGVAFNTTLVGLLLSAILVLLNSLASEREEQVLNDTCQYCLDHCVSRLRNRTVEHGAMA